VNVKAAFELQAQACEALGSPFTALVLTLLPGLLRPGNPVADRILAWPGDLTHRGDSVPLRLAGGLHALARTGEMPELSALYPPGSLPSSEALKHGMATALDRHSAPLLAALDHPPQTNEVARSAVLIAAGNTLAGRFGLPFRLLELGASAGLNLYWDRYALDLGTRLIGPADSSVVLRPDWTGKHPQNATVSIASREGVDLNPLDPNNRVDQERLLSYIWPDQSDRLNRMKNAFVVAASDPVRVDRADAIDWLAKKLDRPVPDQLTWIFHTVAWQYLPLALQNRGAEIIRAAGQRASKSAPLAWFSMEGDGGERGAALVLRLWPGNVRMNLGRADFHGRWVEWAEG